MIDLYSVPTANGQRVHVMLEECGLPYTPHFVDLVGGEHLELEFQTKNPFGRAPAIVDRDGPGGQELRIFEGHAILFYLAEKSGKFYPNDLGIRTEIHAWISAISSNLSPAFAAQFWFTVLAPERNQMALDRFVAEAHRGLKTLDTHLEGRAYFVGDDYTIADIHAYPVVATSASRLDGGLGAYPSLLKWMAAISEREAVQKGMSILAE